MQVRSAGISDIGLKREGNEDAYSIEDSMGLYIVADGMGGHLAGEVASRVAVEMLNRSFKKWVTEKVLPRVHTLLPESEILIIPMSLTSGVHMGPGTWSIAWVGGR